MHCTYLYFLVLCTVHFTCMIVWIVSPFYHVRVVQVRLCHVIYIHVLWKSNVTSCYGAIRFLCAGSCYLTCVITFAQSFILGTSSLNTACFYHESIQTKHAQGSHSVALAGLLWKVGSHSIS